MVLSPADFYAYSKATGALFPSTAEERAALAPKVLGFRRNQLKGLQETPARGGLGRLAALGVAAIANELGAGRPPAATASNVNINAIPEAAVRRVVQEYPSTILQVQNPQQVVKYGSTGFTTPFNKKYIEQRGMVAPGDMTTIKQAEAPQITDQHINAVQSSEDQMTGRVRQQLQRNEDIDASQYEELEDIYERIYGNIGDIDEDVYEALQEDSYEATRQEMIENTDPSELFEYEPDAAINQAASRLPDGLPMDQAEGLNPGGLGTSSAQRFLQNERNNIAQDLIDSNVPATPGRVEAKLSDRLGANAYKYGPKYTARKQALELYAQTGDPKLLETVRLFKLAPAGFQTFENMPKAQSALRDNSPPMSLGAYPSDQLIPDIAPTGVEINLPGVGRVDLASLRRPVITENAALRAANFIKNETNKQQNFLEDVRAEVGERLAEITEERLALMRERAAEIKLNITDAESRGDIRQVRELEYNLNNLRKMYKNPQLHPHRKYGEGGEVQLIARLKGAEKSAADEIANLRKKFPTALNDMAEGGRIFGFADKEGNLIPESIEIRSERKAIDTKNKGGGGRNIAEYTAGAQFSEQETRPIGSLHELKLPSGRAPSYKGYGVIRDADVEGNTIFKWRGDDTQTGSETDIYGIRLSTQPAADPEMRPSDVKYTKKAVAKYKREQERQPYTPQGRASVDVSSKLRRLQMSGRPGEAQAFLDKMIKQQGLNQPRI